MDKHKLIIDGIVFEPDPSRTVLEVAREAGIEIPTLCNHRALSPSGACRICTVEAIRRGGSKLVTACTYPAWDGEIRTNSEIVKRARRFILQLMLAAAPEAEDIKKLAAEYGVETTPYKQRTDSWSKKCIMCGLCVRVCTEVMQIGAIGFSGRGDRRMVGTPFDKKSEVCVACGACAEVCPTGAIAIGDNTDIEPIPMLSEFNVGMQRRPAIYTPFPQAVPKVPALDETSCMHFFNDSCGVCETVCGPKAISFEPNEKEIELGVGAVVVATGFDQFDATKKPELGYEDYDNVITGLEFERLVSPSGPTGGEILIGGKAPKKVVLVHCVGSRDETVGNEYCSRVCCMYLAKHAHLIKEKIPDAEITSLFIDFRAFGKGYEEFYNRVKKEGVIFRRGNVSEIYRKRGKTIVKAEDTLLGEPIELEADLVILGTGIVPRSDVTEMSRLIKVSQSADGFFSEAHPKLRPVDTASDGIFLAGCAQGPKDIPDTVAQAKAAASSSIEILSKKRLTIAPIVAIVDKDICSGCRVCETVCEYGAHDFDEIFGVMTVNPVLCKGCGSCATACPSSAIRINEFTDEQIRAQIESLIAGI